MNKQITIFLLSLLIAALNGPAAFSQLSGIKTIDNTLPTSGNNYNSFTDAFTALNSSGAGAGGVTFNVTAGQTFNDLPPVLSATGTASNPVIFQKNGAGNNPVVVPNFPGILSTTTFGNHADGIIVINGGDFITFDGIDVNADSNPGDGNIEKYEYGYYLKKASGTDACKSVAIKNATITLQQNIGTVVAVGCGIFVSNNSGTSSNITVTSTGGISENIKISGNTLLTCQIGIQVRGFNVTTFRDNNIEIGVDGGNNIVSFGFTGTPASTIAVYGVFALNQNNLKVANNIMTTGTLITGPAFYGIRTEAGTNSNVDIYNNTVTLSSGNSTFTGISFTGSGTSTDNVVRIYNNTITDCENSTTGSNSITLLHSGNTLPRRFHIYGNSLTNNTKNNTGGGQLIGIEIGSSLAAGDSLKIFDNLISGNVVMGGTNLRGTNTALGPNAGNAAIYNNIIKDNVHTGTGTLICLGSTGTGAVQVIHGNRIYNNISSSQVRGIESSSSQTVYNNVISELYAPDGTNVEGIRLAGSGPHRIFNNTIYLNAASSLPDFESSGINFISTTANALTLRNNIVVNVSQPGSGEGSYTVAFRRAAGVSDIYNAASNNNNFYAGIPGPKNLIFHNGDEGDETIGEFKGRVAPRDNNSFTELSPFLNISASPYNLRLNPASPTGVESGGQTISSPVAITTDFDGTPRYPNVGYPVKPGFPPTAPDIGAFEFGGEHIDIIAPVISYTPLGPISSLSNRTLTATITDASGISGGANMPRLYYKKLTDAAYSFDNAPTINGNNYTWTINYSQIGGVSFNDRIVYYVAAQDVSGNLSTVPAGATGINPPGTNPTPTPNFYDIWDPAPMSGTYIIGYGLFRNASGINLEFEKRVAEVINGKNEVEQKTDLIPVVNGVEYTEPLYYEFTDEDRIQYDIPDGGIGVFPNFFAAIFNLNSRGVNGPVTFLLDDASYNNETFPLVFDVIAGSSQVNTITFKPNVDATVSISSSSTNSIIKLNGADNIIIDGSNIPGGTTRDLTIINNHTGANNAAIWLSSLGTGAGAQNNTIKNCNISAGGSSSSRGIISSGTSTNTQIPDNEGADNNNNSFINNYITRCQFGIYIRGIAANVNINNIVTGNTIGANEFGDEQIGYYGVAVSNQAGITITNNTIRYIGGLTTGSGIGIGLGYFTVGTPNWNTQLGTSITNATVSGNLIYEIRSPGFNGNAIGILMASNAANSNNMVANNVIHTILGLGGTNTSVSGGRCIGICILNGDNDRVLFNTINMVGNLNPTSASSTANAAGVRIANNNTTNLTLMNNIISVDVFSGNPGAKHYTIIVPSDTYSWGTGGADYNDYHFNSGNVEMGLGGLGLGGAAVNAIENLEDWRNQFSQSQDKYSMSRNPGFISSTNLQPDPLNTNSWHVNGMGKIIPSVNSDFNGNSRSITPSDGPVDIGAYEFVPDESTIPQPVFLTENISVGRLQEMFFADRLIGFIEWTNGSALPTSIDVRFRPGAVPPSPIGGGYSRAYWTVTQTGGTNYEYTIGLTYEESQIGNISSEANIRMGKYDAGNWTIYNDASVDVSTNTVTKPGLTGFSSFALSDLNNPLPVELSSFTASVDRRDVYLNWTTSGEMNNSGFDIERSSVISSEWTKVGFINGAGTANEARNYSFSDMGLQTGKYSYRLKQIDYNGNYEYFNLEGIIEIGIPKEFSLDQNFPNPFNPVTKIGYEIPVEGLVKLLIYDISGREVATVVNDVLTPGYYTVEFNGVSLSSGVYFYRLVTNNSVITKKMFMVK